MEGCIHEFGTDANNTYTIAATSAQSNIPAVVLESDKDIEPPTVSDYLITAIYLTNRTIQPTALIFAVPAHVCVYKRIQKFDSVRIIGGPFVNTSGTVKHIYHGTGWYIIGTPKVSLRLYRTDIELNDRLCVDDFVRVSTPNSPFLGRRGVISKVDAEGNIEMVATPGNVSL